jgi:hypothetical protein
MNECEGECPCVWFSILSKNVSKVFVIVVIIIITSPLTHILNL